MRAEGHASAAFDFPAGEWELTELNLGELPLEPPTLLAGRVTDLEGKPLPDLWVQASIEPAQRDRLGPFAEDGFGYLDDLGATIEARTDTSGRFAFADLPSGHWELSAGAKGWARGGELALDLGVGERRTDVSLRFDPGLSISGVVVDAGGAPVPSATVGATKAGGLDRATYDLAREDGSFSIHGLEPGLYRLDGSVGLTGSDAYASRSWGAFSAGAGELRLVLLRAARLHVRVVDRLGDPLPGAWVGLLGPEDSWFCGAADEEGRYELAAPEGEAVDVRAAANSHFDPHSNFLDSFFLDEHGEWLAGTWTTVSGVVAGPDEVVVTIPGLP